MTKQETITSAIGKFVESGALAGAASLVWRNNEVVHAGGVGWRDMEAGLPVERDTIFRIASMTKPITCAAALMLMEEGRFALDDPITRWAPEFSNMRVLRSANGPLDQTDQAERPITFDDLLTHRSGLTYGAFHKGPIADSYPAALGRDIDSHLAPDEWIAALGGLPLIDQPGAAFHYGHSTDLLGFLIARMEDAPLSDVLERRIFRPLGMNDTSFVVPKAKRSRCAAMYGFDRAGRLCRRLTATAESTMAERPDDMAFVSGGAGLWSTLDDYLKFARMFVGEGAVDGVRLLQPSTLKMMASNQLTADQRASSKMFGTPIFAAGHGFGLGVAVVLEPEKAQVMLCRGGVRTVGWAGAWGAWWQADPTDGSVLIFLAHNMVEPAQWAAGVGFGAFEAIAQFHSLATNIAARV